MIKNLVKKRENNWSGALLAIAAAMNGAPHKFLDNSSCQGLYEHSGKLFNPI